METRLSEEEILCVNKLSEMFEKGERIVTISIPDDEDDEPALDPLGLPAHSRNTTLETMQHLGAIADVEHCESIRFFSYRITATALQLARLIKTKRAEIEPEDIVERIKTAAKSKPVIAWPIIVFTVLTIAATFFAAVLTIIDKIIDLQRKIGGP